MPKLATQKKPVRNLFRSHASGEGFFSPTNSQNGTWTNSYPIDSPWGRYLRKTSTVIGNIPASAMAIADGNGMPLQAAVVPTSTISLYVRSSITNVVRLRAQWLNSSDGSAGVTDGPDITLIPNTWTRLNVTATPNAATARLRHDIFIAATGSVFAAGETFDIAAAMCTVGKTLFEYADGNTLGWRWDSGSQGSSSVGYPLSPLIIRNIMKFSRTGTTMTRWNVSGYGTGGNGNWQVADGKGVDGGYALEQIWTAAPTGGGASIVTSSSFADDTLVNPGVTYRFSIWGYLGVQRPSVGIEVNWMNNLGASIKLDRPSATGPAGWFRYSATLTAPANAVKARIGFRQNDLAGVVVGHIARADQAMANISTTLYPFADGLTTGWSFEGVPGESTSISYPYN